jgi:hypothetical protein
MGEMGRLGQQKESTTCKPERDKALLRRYSFSQASTVMRHAPFDAPAFLDTARVGNENLKKLLI